MIALRGPALCVALVCALPASADWLVLHDGTRIETAGEWRQEGRQVIFRLPGGTLSALPAAEVDLAASAAASAPPVDEPDPSAAARPARRPAVLRLTNADVARAAPEPEADADDADDADDAEDAALSTPAEPVRLVSWQSRDSEEVSGLEINGTVRNAGESIATGIRVMVRVRDVEGEELVETRAFLAAPSLAPGKSSAFRALLPDVFSLPVDPEFTIESDGFSVQGEAGASAVPEPEDETADDFQR